MHALLLSILGAYFLNTVEENVESSGEKWPLGPGLYTNMLSFEITLKTLGAGTGAHFVILGQGVAIIATQ